MENILKYEKLVNSIASKFSYYSNFEDLKQEGMIGLLKAIQKYQPNDRTKFSTYAVYWIKGEILEYLRKDKNIKFSKEILSLSKKVDICYEQLRNKWNKEPSISEIAYCLEESEANIIDAIYAKELILSSDYGIKEDEDGKEINLYDMVPYYEIGYQDDVLDLKLALEELSEEEKEIIHLRYFQEMTQSEVSKRLGTNQVQISRNESKILQKLKENITA